MIPVKLEKEEGKYMLIHGYTGAADIATDDLLKKINEVSSGVDFPESLLQTLLKRGYVTTKSLEEEYAHVARIARALHKESKILNTTFTWVVSYNCNFRCPYCFEDRKRKNGKERLSFTKEQVDIAYETQDRIQPHKELRRNTITLYGGEPLLAENEEVVRYIVAEGRKRGYTFEAITNGYEVDHFLDLLAPDSIKKLQITIDGPREIHDRRRIHYKDHQTFDKIVENIKLALDKGIVVTVRMNTDAHNIEKFVELKEYFRSFRFLDYPNFNIYPSRLRDYTHLTPREHKDLGFISPQSFTEKQIELNAEPVRKEGGMYKGLYTALLNKRSIPFYSIACAAQSGECVLDPLGNIYPCWEVVGKKEFVKATYNKEGLVWNQEVLDKWQNSNISQKEPCKHCQYALICGGGCHYHNIINGIKAQCDTFKGTFNQIINKAYAELNNH